MPEQSSLYNTDILVQTHHADDDFIKYMVTLFVKHVPETNANLEKACAEKDWENVYFFAHKMKASIDLFNLTPLKELVRKVEQHAHKLIETEAIADEVKVISDYLQRCVAAMKEEYQLD